MGYVFYELFVFYNRFEILVPSFPLLFILIFQESENSLYLNVNSIVEELGREVQSKKGQRQLGIEN